MALFIKRAANALDNAASDLLIHQQGVYDAATVFNGPEMQHFDEARFDINFHMRGHRAIGEHEWKVCDAVMAGRNEFGI